MCVLPGPRMSLEVGYVEPVAVDVDATREMGVEATGVGVFWGPAARRAL